MHVYGETRGSSSDRQRPMILPGAADLTVEALPPAAINPAYSLVRIAAPEVGLDRWRRYCAGRIGGGPASGMLAARSPKGVLLGLCAFGIADDLFGGCCLHVDWLLAFHPLQAETVIRALIGAAQRLAAERGCAALRIDLPAGAAAIRDLLSQTGYRAAGEQFRLELRSAET